eukprot:gene10990-14761_t
MRKQGSLASLPDRAGKTFLPLGLSRTGLFFRLRPSVTPIRLSFAKEDRPKVASALDALLKANGEQLTQNGKTFALGAFATPEDAQAAIAQPGERILIEKLPEFMNSDNCVWVA